MAFKTLDKWAQIKMLSVVIEILPVDFIMPIIGPFFWRREVAERRDFFARVSTGRAILKHCKIVKINVAFRDYRAN